MVQWFFWLVMLLDVLIESADDCLSLYGMYGFNYCGSEHIKRE